ncbi:hypothetical protein [Aestuariibius sp. HNIBRBA575]|uniref:hypothetical protein n=1 Tax=Aestuariibius sp. HNIBRBA575 TaxID=3233343 RepID=UPI0034A367F0
MPHAKKSALRDAMLALESAELESAREHYETYLAESHLDDRSSIDRDEMSQARINADLAHSFDAPIHTHEAKIVALQSLDFTPKSEVEPGAVVSFGGRNFVVSVSTRKFDCNGETYMGISVDTPIYRQISGLQEGDEFEQNGVKFILEKVY